MLFNYDIYIYLVVLKVCAIKTNVPPDLFIPTDCLKVRYKYYLLVSNPCLKACQVQSLFTDQTEIFWPSLFHYRLLYRRMTPLSLKRVILLKKLGKQDLMRFVLWLLSFCMIFQPDNRLSIVFIYWCICSVNYTV